MELTGKCKEDFEKWLNKNWEEKFLTGTQRAYEFYTLKWFNEFSLSMKWGVYLDFFDSKGITIEVTLFDKNNWQHYINETYDWFVDFKNRNDAQNSAIKKADQYYNFKSLTNLKDEQL